MEGDLESGTDRTLELRMVLGKLGAIEFLSIGTLSIGKLRIAVSTLNQESAFWVYTNSSSVKSS